MSFIAELRRRNVVRVGIAYAVVGWFIAQLAEFAFENFGAPDWVLKSFVVVLILGFPVALIFAWAFELTPDGLKRERDVDRSQSITRVTGRRLDFIIIAALAVALAYFAWERQADRAMEPVADAGSVTAAVPAADAPSQRSIAVLPFVNMSSDEEQQWFSDGLTEEILNALARTPDLLVAARTSSFKYKNSTDDVPTIATALGVAHVLEGSVRRDADRLRVTAQLIRASDGFHLWSQTYDRLPDDVIAIQEDVAVEIATALETAMDPDALKAMVSAGTNSVSAYNAYLEGLAFGVSTVSTGDAYIFLSAREAFERAVDADPEFALAHWELAGFWQIQLSTNNIVAGLVEMPPDAIAREFDDAINKAIEYERDPANRTRSRVLKSYENLQFAQALRLNEEYLQQRPNDQQAQNLQLNLLANMSRDEELQEAIREYESRDGHDVVVATNSMTYSLISDDSDFIRGFAQRAVDRMSDSAFVVYQAHRSLLWAGDIDGASRLYPALQSSDLPESSRKLVTLRQACAEGRQQEAVRAFEWLETHTGEDVSLMWIGRRILGRDAEAVDVLSPLDNREDLGALADFLSYAYFDARDFPNLMRLLESQGVEPREPRAIPYRCRA